MRKLLLLTTLLATPAFGADLAYKAAPIVPVTYNPFYLGIEGGMGFSADQSIITIAGTPLGTPKQFPTAPSVGAVFGYINTSGALAWGGEIFADYNFSHQSINCVPGAGCLAEMKNSWSLGEDLLVGFTLGQIISATPGNVQPQNWKFPITVPGSIMNNMMILASVGGAQRNIDLCTAIDAVGTMGCGNEWLGGLSVGGQIRFLAAGQWEIAGKYHHNFYNHAFVQDVIAGVVSSTHAVKGEDTFKIAAGYHF